MKWNSNNQKCDDSNLRALFAASKEDLCWLCHTLTGNAELSGQVVEAALEQSLKGANEVFRDWMLSWARRLIIKFCVTTVRPGESAQPQSGLSPISFGAVNRDQLREVLSLPSAALQEVLLQLDTLSRFVFVLRAIEGYTRRDTALLLSIDDRTCEWVYVRAIETLGTDLAHETEQDSSAVPMDGFTDYNEQTNAPELVA